MLSWIRTPIAARAAAAWPSDIRRAAGPGEADGADDVRSPPARIDPDRARQHGARRGPGRSLLGRADPAVAPPLPDRPGAVSARDDPRVRNPQEGVRPGEQGPRPPPGGQGAGDRPGRRRGDRRSPRRPLPAGGVADRERHPDQHERQRGDREPRDRDPWRRAGLAARPSQRRRQPEPVVERHLPDRHARRDRGAASRSPVPGRPASAGHARPKGRGQPGRRQDRAHPSPRRGAAHPGSGDLGLGEPARSRPRPPRGDDASISTSWPSAAPRSAPVSTLRRASGPRRRSGSRS